MGSTQGRPARRVTYLTTSSAMGGAEREVADLALEFRRRGWRVNVISMLPLEPPIADLAADGIGTQSLGMRQGVPDPRALVRLGRLLRRQQPDVFHAHMVHANLLARLSRLVAPTPRLITTMHSENEGAGWRYLAYRLTDRLSHVTTAVSHLVAAEATRRGAAAAGRILVVPNGIDTAPYGSDARTRRRMRASLDVGDRFTWLAVGNLGPAKGYADMLEAFVTVLRERPDATLLIAGAGRLEDELRAAVRAAGSDSAVRLLGRRTDVAALLQAADAFVMTSHWEGLPMALLEAGASALPVVATDVGGSREAVLDGRSGFLTPARAPDATAAAMLRVMRLSAPDRAAMGAAGRELVRGTFEIGVVADAWERIYLGSNPEPVAARDHDH